MRIEVLDQAAEDLIEGFWFYETQDPGLGSYFLTSLFAEIESLRIYAGIHPKRFKEYYRLLSHRFPFAVFYKILDGTVFIHAVLDCRRSPAWRRMRLQ